jgi:pyruvate formate lyase activating enzyme
VKGLITEIHRAALDDGPGVRTVVFFKGCPLRCLWCHNPETQNPQPEKMYRQGKTETVGREVTVEEIMKTVVLDIGFYKATGGGLTLSGGEPLAQPYFASVLLQSAKENNIHTCVETSGAGDIEPLLPYVDLWLFDIKGFPRDYEWLTGGSFFPIEKNLRTLLKQHAEVILRCPIIPGVHDNVEYETYLDGLPGLYPGIKNVEKLPFHRLGMDKYEALGRQALY